MAENPEFSTDLVLYVEDEHKAWLDLAPDSLHARQIRDYAGRVALQERYEEADQMARTDGLTGAMTRHEFRSAFDVLVYEQERIADGSRATESAARGLGLLLLDLDDFDLVNNEYGHPAGDQVLIEFVEMLREILREDDLVCRAGGDEFMIGLSGGVDEEAMKDVAERIVEGTEHIIIGDPAKPLSVSVGGALFEYGKTTESMIGLADDRMRAAKLRGKGRAELTITEEQMLHLRRYGWSSAGK